MIPRKTTGKGPAIAGALFLSGCSDRPAFHDTLFLATQPLELLTWYLGIIVVLLGAWWIIAKLSASPPRRAFLTATLLLFSGLLMTSAPTLMLVTGVVWPSVFIVMQVGAVGLGVIALAVLFTAFVLIWQLIAKLIDRL